MLYDLFTIGPAGLDTLVNIDDADVHCSINTQLCQVCLRYGDKIIAKGITTKTAYNGMNNAVGGARLGMKTTMYCVVGDDDNGQRILRTLRKETVSPRYVQVARNRSTNASVVIDYHAERTILVHHGAEDRFDFPKKPPEAHWVYLTSFGGPYQSLYRQVVRYLAAHPKTKLGFNPGSFQLKDDVKRLRPILKRTTALFLNRDEARIMTGIRREKTERQLLNGMLALGASIAVMTDGPVGSFATDGRSYWQLGIYPSPVIERTGCGDSFASGFMAALHYKQSMVEAMRWGTLNAAGVLQHIGPQDGLLTLSTMRRQVQKTKRSLQPRILK
ncbi:MAG: carbohydrate kinase family protein [Patescibacteria group bacterium]